MTVLALIVTAGSVVSVATWASVWLADRIHARENPPEPTPPPPTPAPLSKEAREEIKRVLERDRTEWTASLTNYRSDHERMNITQRLAQIDQSLLELAERP